MAILSVVKEIQQELNKLNTTIDAYEANQMIQEYNRLMKDKKELETRLKIAIELIEPDLEKSEFVSTRRGGYEVYWEEDVGVERRQKTTRKIIGEKFINQFPFLAGKLAKFTLKDVEKNVSKEELEAVTETKLEYSYKPVTRKLQKVKVKA